MVNVELDVGDKIQITFKDSDGKFEVEFASTYVKVSSELPGSTIGKSGVIYLEEFGYPIDGVVDVQSKTEVYANDERIFLASISFVVKTYEGHWNCVRTAECQTFEEAITKVTPRSLMYCITPAGRHAVFGSGDWERLKRVKRDN